MSRRRCNSLGRHGDGIVRVREMFDTGVEVQVALVFRTAGLLVALACRTA